VLEIKEVKYDNPDFYTLCGLLEEEHKVVVREQRSPYGNCLKRLDGFSTVFVAYDNNKPIGCLAMKEIEDGKIGLGRLYVLPEYRKQGVARALFDKVFAEAKKQGAKSVTLDTYKRFEAAVSLYKKLGFTMIDNYREDSPFSLCMEKYL
jgi:ribosomal protein S18 acetylase RimI-like enzyme